MPRYLFRARYTQQGISGVVKEGGSSRAAAVEQTLQGLGGRAESQYWAFGEDDYILIAELPDNVSAAALAATVAQSGAASITTSPLLTAEEIDQVTQRQVQYRPPGG